MLSPSAPSEQCAIALIAPSHGRRNTDGNEIGGAMTADTPPELRQEAR